MLRSIESGLCALEASQKQACTDNRGKVLSIFGDIYIGTILL